MPPVLDIAGYKLAGSGPQEMSPCVSPGSRSQSHDVLELVAESKRAAQLIKSCSCPHPGRKRLIEEPSIGKQIHGSIGRRNLHGIQNFIPPAGRLQQSLIQVFCPISADQFTSLLAVFGLPEKKHNF